jgi:PAS domain S-box-containing protein
LRAQTDRYEALLAALSEAGEGMLILEEDGRCVYANAAFEQISGYTAPELAALDSLFALVVPEQREDARRRALARVEGGLVDPGYEVAIRHRDGSVVRLDVVGVPLAIEGGHRIVVVVHDVTDRRHAEAERERLLAHVALMAEASSLFDETLDEAETLERVARLCVRALADTCLVALAEADGAVRRVAAAARAPETERALLELQLRHPLDETPGPAIAAVMRDGRSRSVDGDAIPALGARAALLVPLRARGATHGVLALGFAHAQEGERAGLLERVEDLGRRAALALDNARLYEDRSAVAHTLQQSLLPPTLPHVPGVEIAARYLAAGAGNEVGGDFYDCFATADGEWAVLIGDVCGKGAPAAAITALARHTVRAAVVHDRRPESVLGALNEAILRHGTDARFCTVLYVAFTPRPDGAEACVATGGHPLPLILRSAGEVDPVGSFGTLLGVVADPEISTARADLGPGDALVLFTDGVVEASPLEAVHGTERLAGWLADVAGRDAGRIAEAVEERVLDVQRGALRDDVAVVVLRVPPRAPAPFAALGEGVAARS